MTEWTDADEKALQEQFKREALQGRRREIEEIQKLLKTQKPEEIVTEEVVVKDTEPKVKKERNPETTKVNELIDTLLKESKYSTKEIATLVSEQSNDKTKNYQPYVYNRMKVLAKQGYSVVKSDSKVVVVTKK